MLTFEHGIERCVRYFRWQTSRRVVQNEGVAQRESRYGGRKQDDSFRGSRSRVLLPEHPLEPWERRLERERVRNQMVGASGAEIRSVFLP